MTARPLTGHLALPVTSSPRSYLLSVAQAASGGWWLYETPSTEPLALRPLTRAEVAWAEVASRSAAPSPTSPALLPPPSSLYGPSPTPPPPEWRPYPDLLGEEGVDWSESDDTPTGGQTDGQSSPGGFATKRRPVGDVVLSLLIGGRP